jgi:hypothetical protein
MDVNRAAVDYGPAGHPAPVYRKPLARVARRRNSPVRSYLPKKVALKAEDHRVVRVAKASGVFAHRVEHSLNLGWRGRDDA